MRRLKEETPEVKEEKPAEAEAPAKEEKAAPKDGVKKGAAKTGTYSVPLKAIPDEQVVMYGENVKVFTSAKELLKEMDSSLNIEYAGDPEATSPVPGAIGWVIATVADGKAVLSLDKSGKAVVAYGTGDPEESTKLYNAVGHSNMEGKVILPIVKGSIPTTK